MGAKFGPHVVKVAVSIRWWPGGSMLPSPEYCATVAIVCALNDYSRKAIPHVLWARLSITIYRVANQPDGSGPLVSGAVQTIFQNVTQGYHSISMGQGLCVITGWAIEVLSCHDMVFEPSPALRAPSETRIEKPALYSVPPSWYSAPPMIWIVMS